MFVKYNSVCRKNVYVDVRLYRDVVDVESEKGCAAEWGIELRIDLGLEKEFPTLKTKDLSLL